MASINIAHDWLLHIRDRVDLSIDCSRERLHSNLCVVVVYPHKLFVFSSVSSGKCPDITWIRPWLLHLKLSVIVPFNAVAKMDCRWSPILFHKLVSDLITRIQNTAFCQRNRIQSERTILLVWGRP